jgi:hypothetical protein
MRKAFFILLGAFTVLVLLRIRNALPDRKYLSGPAGR